MTDTEIAEAVRGIVAETLNVDLRRVSDKACLIDDLGADSLDMIEISMCIEETFGIVLADRDISDFSTVGELVALARDAMEARQPA